MTRRGSDDESDRRRAAYRWGLSAETRAAWYLCLKGYRILARRFRGASGEIDLIARRGQTIAFVEVKARPGEAEALEAVDWRSRRRIEATALGWVARHPGFADFTWRYDIIIVRPGRWPRHLAGAFRAGE